MGLEKNYEEIINSAGGTSKSLVSSYKHIPPEAIVLTTNKQNPSFPAGSAGGEHYL